MPSIATIAAWILSQLPALCKSHRDAAKWTPPPKKLWALGEATVCCGFFSFSYFLFCFFAVPWGKEWLFYLAEKTLHVDLHLSLRVSCLRQRNILSLVDKGHAEYSWNSDSSQNYVWWGKQILLICPERWTSYISVVSC